MLAFPPAVRAAAALLFLFLLGTHAQAQVSVPITDENAATAEDRIAAALQQQVSFTFREEPLKDAIDAIKQKTGLPIVLAAKRLEEAAINLETPVTVSLHDLTLDSFLRNFLGDLGLTFLVKDEVIQITTPEDAGSRLITRLYPVLDLVARRTPVYEANAVVTSRTAGGRMGTADYESIMNVITTTIDPDSWDDVGGPGSLAQFDNAGVLIISQTWDVHQKIGPLLNSLRRVKGLQGLPTLAPQARVSTPARSMGSRQNMKGGFFSAESAAPVARRRGMAPQHSWQVPQVYEE
jgi:hypothetical protein